MTLVCHRSYIVPVKCCRHAFSSTGRPLTCGSLNVRSLSTEKVNAIILIYGNMADASVVLCNAVCFLTHRVEKSAVKCLKSSVLDFYRVEELSDAKKRLLQDVNNLNVGLDMPHVPERCDGELRIVDDIFTVLIFLDENLKLQLLPKYVADGPDSMPSTRLYEGDLSILMKHIDIINDSHANRFAALGTTDDERNDVPFTEHHSRR